MGIVEVDSHVDERLRSDAIVLLTTVRPDGRPVTVPVWFAWRNPEVTIYAPTATGKVANLAVNPRVALALDSAGGTDVVLMSGDAVLGPEGEAGAAEDEVFVAKYGDRMGPSAGEWAAQFERRITVTVRNVRAWLASYD